MKILHLSDIHLMLNGTPIWDTYTKQHFDQAIECIKQISDIDMIIITGDLSNDGSLWSYQYIDKAFAKLGIPTYCCPGNHDDLSTILEKFSPTHISFQTSVQNSGYNFIFLNSVIQDDCEPLKNKARGFLSENSLNILKTELGRNLPSIVVLHHPPLEQEGWLNRKLLDNRFEFNKILMQYSNVKLVLYGHIHYESTTKTNGILYHSAPAIGFAYNPNLPKYHIAKGEEGFSIVNLNNEGEIYFSTATLADQ